MLPSLRQAHPLLLATLIFTLIVILASLPVLTRLNGADLTYHSFSHLNTAVSLLLRPYLGALPAYNVTILANYVLIGLSMFHLARGHSTV